MKILTKFIAEDGTVFDTEEECLIHENGFHVILFGNISKVKRKKFVNEQGVHYPIRIITAAVPYGTKATEFIQLEFDEYEGQHLNGHGLRKGVAIGIQGCLKAYGYEKDGRVKSILRMKNPSINSISLSKKKYAKR